ncbi:MAG: WD40 repeat domain-containing protein [Cyanobacteria bacterium J06635_1]
MRLLPCTTFTVQTRAALSQVIQRLNFHIETSRRFDPNDHVPYVGSLSTLGFKIGRIFRPCYPPLLSIRGRFEARSEGTKIYITFRPSFAAVLAAVGLLLIGGLGTLLSWASWLPLAVSTIGLFALASSLWHAVRCRRRELTKILLGASLKSYRYRWPNAYKPIFMGFAGLALAIGLYQITTWQPSSVPSQPAHECAQVASSPYCQLQPMYTLTGHPTATVLAMSNDGQTLVSGGRDKAIRVWDTATGQLRRTLQSESGVVRGIAIAPDGKTLVSVNGDVRVRIWDITSNQPPTVIAGHTVALNQVAISADGKIVVSAGDSEIKVWDMATGQLRASLPDSSASLRSVNTSSINPSGFRLLALSPDGGTVLLESGNQWLTWDVAKQQTRVLQTPWADTLYGFVRNAQISLDNQSVVTTAYSQPVTQLKVWNLATGEAQAQNRMSTSDEKYWLNTVALSRDRIVGSTPEGLKIWRLPTAELEATLAAPTMSPLVISPNGMHLAGIVRNGEEAVIQVWQRLDDHNPDNDGQGGQTPVINSSETTIS